MIDIEQGSGNVYADLDSPDADEMQIKARLAAEIATIIKRRRLTQSRASELVGISQPRLSGLLRGQFRGISEAKMLECLALLGREVRIVVGPARPRSKPGQVELDVTG